MSTKRKWTSKDIPDQTGKVAIVTGANTGLGFDTARVLAGKQAEVIIACRNLEKGQDAIKRIKADHPEAKVCFMTLDLSNLSSVQNFAHEFKSNHSSLDLLINNAGVMMSPFAKTSDGFELQFGTNHLGHFALTGLLLELILNRPNSRVINVSSMAHRAGKLNLDDLNWEKRKYDTMQAYGDSKIANLYFTYELQKQLDAHRSKALAVAAHPGWTATDLQRHASLFNFLNTFFAQKPEKGILPTLYAAIANNVKGGDYYGPNGFMEMRGYPKKVTSKPLSHDNSIAAKLWEKSEQLSGVNYSFETPKKITKKAVKSKS